MASKLLQSDFSLNLDAFGPNSTSESTHKLNEAIIQKCKEDNKWWEVRTFHKASHTGLQTFQTLKIQQVGASTYRELRAAGKTPFPPAPRLDEFAKDFTIKSPTTQTAISCRGFFGDGVPPAGIYYHIHGGGYVLGSAAG
jgi:acetyl esterase/lipase